MRTQSSLLKHLNLVPLFFSATLLLTGATMLSGCDNDVDSLDDLGDEIEDAADEVADEVEDTFD